MATDTTYNVSLVTSGEIVASIKDADEVLIYPKTVAQAVTVMQAGYSDGSTTQKLAERLAALDETDSALSTSISTLEETLSETEDSLLGQFDALEDINTALGTVTSQDEVSTSVVTALSEYTGGSNYINVTTTPLLASPVTFDESMTFADAVRTLAAYCHSHSVGGSTTSAVRSTCSYCSCDDRCGCDD